MSADRDTCDLLCLGLPKAERVRAALLPLERLANWAAAAKGRGDPTRTAMGGGPAATITRARYEQLAGRVKLLSWLSLVWMTIEGAVAIAAGIAAGSIALIGFGLDSAIEGFASVIIIWRFTGHRVFSQSAEDRAQKLVAVQFFLLAPYVAFESVKTLLAGDHPDVSWLGSGLSVGSLVAM